MTSQEMINDSVAQSIRQEILSMLVCWQRLQETFTRCDSTSSLFGIGKRTVFKVLKDSPENFTDLSTLADCDTDKSIDAASKLVCRLYDHKGKLKEDHVELNKLRVRLATLRDACLAKLPPCEATFTQHVLRS
jgi:hypothetical protein